MKACLCTEKFIGKQKAWRGGFTMLETLVAIVIFALLSTSIGTSLVMAHRINARSEVLLQEQLKVSRAVEVLMADGIESLDHDYTEDARYEGIFDGVLVNISELAVYEGDDGVRNEVVQPVYRVVVTSRTDLDISAEVLIRPQLGGGS